MTAFSTFSSKFAAGVCALALSLALIGGTVAVPGSAHAQPVAYIAVLA
ncbi:MAG: hypothetical protein JF595_05355 [Sphingomonadales bacterium]|nr:hypothetical protein [Sphingomonadales bacterium]